VTAPIVARGMSEEEAKAKVRDYLYFLQVVR
jgi:hypothetical protein